MVLGFLSYKECEIRIDRKFIHLCVCQKLQKNELGLTKLLQK